MLKLDRIIVPFLLGLRYFQTDNMRHISNGSIHRISVIKARFTFFLLGRIKYQAPAKVT